MLHREWRYLIFYASAKVVRPGALYFRAVRACVTNVVKTVSWKVLDIFHQTSALVHFGTRMNASSFGVKRSKFKVTMAINMLENSLFDLVINPIPWKLLDRISPNFQLTAFWDVDERINFWGQKVKYQGQHDQGHSGRSHTELNAVKKLM